MKKEIILESVKKIPEKLKAVPGRFKKDPEKTKTDPENKTGLSEKIRKHKVPVIIGVGLLLIAAILIVILSIPRYSLADVYDFP